MQYVIYFESIQLTISELYSFALQFNLISAFYYFYVSSIF